jgi:hypothetical protein
MEMKIGNRRLKMIDGKVCIVKFSCLGIEVKSGKFTPIKFSDHDGYNLCGIMIDGYPKKIFEHRLVWKLAHPDWNLWDTSQDNMIDHYNRNRRDNRLENLHVVNQNQNQWNRDAKGYSLKPSGKYESYIKINGLAKYLGTFATEEEARASYLDGKIKYHVIV